MPEIGTKEVQYLVGSTESLFYSPVSVICVKKFTVQNKYIQ